MNTPAREGETIEGSRTPSSGFRVAPSHDDEAEEDERSGPDDDEEDVPDRYQLKESALALVGRSTKRGKKKKLWHRSKTAIRRSSRTSRRSTPRP